MGGRSMFFSHRGVDHLPTNRRHPWVEHHVFLDGTHRVVHSDHSDPFGRLLFLGSIRFNSNYREPFWEAPPFGFHQIQFPGFCARSRCSRPWTTISRSAGGRTSRRWSSSWSTWAGSRTRPAQMWLSCGDQFSARELKGWAFFYRFFFGWEGSSTETGGPKGKPKVGDLSSSIWSSRAASISTGAGFCPSMIGLRCWGQFGYI